MELPIRKDDSFADIRLVISDLGKVFGKSAGSGNNVPSDSGRYFNSRYESENIREFIHLMETDNTPDDDDMARDIAYFRTLSEEAQDKLLEKLNRRSRPAVSATEVPLKFRILMKDVPPEVERVAMAKFTALQRIDPSTTEFYKTSQWVNGYANLPLGVYKELPVRLEDGPGPCQEFMNSVRRQMDSAIHGHNETKLQIMQFVSSWMANPASVGNVLSIYGPPGVGKTTLVKDGIAKALGRPFHFITLGGATDSSYLDGHSYTYEGSTWGRIVDILLKSQCMNPVIYFDELDKVSSTPKGEEIYNLLIHLTDGSQNAHFQDKYFAGIDLDLSRCLFIFSHNNHEAVNPILRDRMYNIKVNGFGVKDKLAIAEDYLVSEALRNVKMEGQVNFGREVLNHIITTYSDAEDGVRELRRSIQTIVNKVNLLRFYNDPAKVPFAVRDFALPFNVSREHINLFLKRKETTNPSLAHIYT
jgi:ATP-dependent Lon protease